MTSKYDQYDRKYDQYDADFEARFQAWLKDPKADPNPVPLEVWCRAVKAYIEHKPITLTMAELDALRVPPAPGNTGKKSPD